MFPEMYLHFGCEETVWFEGWEPSSVSGLFLTFVVIGLVAFLAEAANNYVLCFKRKQWEKKHQLSPIHTLESEPYNLDGRAAASSILRNMKIAKYLNNNSKTQVSHLHNINAFEGPATWKTLGASDIRGAMPDGSQSATLATSNHEICSQSGLTPASEPNLKWPRPSSSTSAQPSTEYQVSANRAKNSYENLADALQSITGCCEINPFPETDPVVAECQAAAVDSLWSLWEMQSHNPKMPAVNGSNRYDFKPPQTVSDDHPSGPEFEMKIFRCRTGAFTTQSCIDFTDTASQLSNSNGHAGSSHRSLTSTTASRGQFSQSEPMEIDASEGSNLQLFGSWHLLSTLIFTVMTVLNALLILILPTYNVWLILAIVLGRSSGYFFFKHL